MAKSNSVPLEYLVNSSPHSNIKFKGKMKFVATTEKSVQVKNTQAYSSKFQICFIASPFVEERQK